MSKEEAVKNLRSAMPHIKLAISMAELQNPQGKIQLAIFARNEDGSGKITASFEHVDFFNDLAEVLEVNEHPGWMHPEDDE